MSLLYYQIYFWEEKKNVFWLESVGTKSYNFPHMMIGRIFHRSVLVHIFPIYFSTAHIFLVITCHDNPKQRRNTDHLKREGKEGLWTVLTHLINISEKIDSKKLYCLNYLLRIVYQEQTTFILRKVLCFFNGFLISAKLWENNL